MPVSLTVDPSTIEGQKEALNELLLRPNIEIVLKEVLVNSEFAYLLANKEETEALKNQVKILSDSKNKLQSELDVTNTELTTLKSNNKALIKSNEELKGQLTVTQNHNQSLESELSKIQNSVSEKEQFITECEKKIEELKNQVSFLEEYQKEQEENAEKEKEELRADYERVVELKQKDITKLSNSLESYGVSYGNSDSNEKVYFEVQPNGLEETVIKESSLFVATRKDGNYLYNINMEGPVKSSLLNVDKYLRPFCNITDFVEGANNIHLQKVGVAKYDGYKFEIIEPITISLVKD